MKKCIKDSLKVAKEYIRNQHQIELIAVLTVFYIAMYIFDSISGLEAILSFIIACIIFLAIPFFVFLFINIIRKRNKE